MRSCARLFSIIVLGCAPLLASASWQVSELHEALQVESRSDADKARDTARKPAQIMSFLGVEPGMTVLDLMGGGGYYTEVISIAVGPEGSVYAQNPQWMLEFMNGIDDRSLSERLNNDRLPNVVRVDGDLASIALPPESVDAAFSALNFHDVYYDYGYDAALALLQQVYAALKPGAAFVLIDHAGNSGLDNNALHRIPEADLRAVVMAAGFSIEAESELLAHPEDDRSQVAFAKGLRGNTDRFVLRLQK